MKLKLFCMTVITSAVIGSGVAMSEFDVSPSLNRGTFGPFIRSLNVKSYGYELIDDPTGDAPSKQVERFEARSGDCHFNGRWSDCERNRERSELWEQGERSLHTTRLRIGPVIATYLNV